jgi:flagella basal body P-ring formation protein FlgA
MHAGQPLRTADLLKPDLVQRDQSVTVIYESPGLYLTTRGKALDNGTEGDVVNVLNPLSKRTVTGIVSGRGQVTIQVATPKPAEDITSSITPAQTGVPLAAAKTASQLTPKTASQATSQVASQVASAVTPKAE